MKICTCGRKMSNTSRKCRTCTDRYLKELRERTERGVAELNEAIQNGAVVMTDTAWGPYRVLSMGFDLWASCAPADVKPSPLNTRSFCMHGGELQNFLKQAGLSV